MRRASRPPTSLGEFEQAVLLTLVRLDHDAYGASIHRDLESRLDRAVSFNAVYATLDRMEAKGYVRSRMGQPTAKRGGRRKRFFALTAAGARALTYTHDTYMKLVHGLEERLETL